MKKWIAMLLTLVLVLSLCACGGNGQSNGGNTTQTTAAPAVEGLQVGYAKINITPEETVPLSGSADSRTSNGMLDYLYGTCVAISDGTDTVLIFSIDIQNAYSPTVGWRSAISKATGIEEARIMLCFTHTHSAPKTDAEDAVISRYNKTVSDKLVQAAEEAVADLCPAQAYTASVETQSLNFVRRYIMNDGSLCGDNFGSTASGYKSHETEADRTLQLVKFTREGSKDVIMANFQMHSNYTIHEMQISSDVAGAFRDAFETKSGANIIYLNGASGNINPTSRMEGENVVSTHREWGEKLADFAMSAESSYQSVALTEVQSVQAVFTVDTNHSDDHLLEQASVIKTYFEQTADRSGAEEMCREAGITSIYHAQTIVTNAARDRTMTIELDAFAIGDIAFIFAPVEMFDTNGMYIKDNSPYAMTFICGYANQCQGYMPSAQAYENSGYEVVTSKFAPGTAEKVADQYLEMLNGLYGEE